MPRPIRPRVSYQADAGFLIRLIQAIEGDEKATLKWRKEQIERIHALVQAFSKESNRRLQSDAGKAA
jgi:hypothetical protein